MQYFLNAVVVVVVVAPALAICHKKLSYMSHTRYHQYMHVFCGLRRNASPERRGFPQWSRDISKMHCQTSAPPRFDGESTVLSKLLAVSWVLFVTFLILIVLRDPGNFHKAAVYARKSIYRRTCPFQNQKAVIGPCVTVLVRLGYWDIEQLYSS